MPQSAVEFGLLLHTAHLVGDGTTSGDLGEFWQSAMLAEEVGFDHVWVGDSPRVRQRQGLPHADCIAILSALAMKTSTLRLGIVPLTATLRNPVMLAHSLATLDLIAAGRLILALSIGPPLPVAEPEFLACGVPFGERAGRLSEAIQVMRRLWSEQSVTFEGRYYQLRDVQMLPKPIQDPLPIWIATSSNETALKRVARLGDGWFIVPKTLSEFVRDRQKIDAYARGYGRGNAIAGSALYAAFHIGIDGDKAREEGWGFLERFFGAPRSRLGYIRTFFGTPDECAIELQGYVDAGATSMVARVVSPDLKGQSELLLRELKPRLSLPL